MPPDDPRPTEQDGDRHGERSRERGLVAGVLVDHFKILRLLGRGGMGEVYLARDTKLGRRVAIKVLLPEALGTEDAVERFLFEARATARFSFPNIVTLHAIGEFDGRPYLAMEYLEGESLWERLQRERLSTQESARIGLAIAEALEEAHRHQILHRDLKPGNVMIPPDGRIRVVDFGLAKLATGNEPPPLVEGDDLADAESFRTITRGARGTPAYMAPEQWNEEQVTTATDVWALGMVLYEMVAGEHPFDGMDVPQICKQIWRPEALALSPGDAPPELTDLIARCVDKSPDRRPAIGSVVDGLHALLHGEREPATDQPSPFRGLLPFDERHASLFHGRDAEIAGFVERLRRDPVIPVVGPSGSGKSSFVQAGVIPRLREQGRWTVLRLRPGNRPFLALAASLHTRGSSLWTSLDPPPAEFPPAEDSGRYDPREWEREEQSLIRSLTESPASLSLVLADLAEREGTRVLLFVDQLEELYTQVEDPQVRSTFMEAICLAADEAEGPARVLFTLREDFLGRLVVGPASRAVLGHAEVLVAPTEEGLADILTRTVAEAGYEFDDPDLPRQMVDEVRHETAALPLLQFAGSTMWQRRDVSGRLLVRAVYEEIGGVAGCLAHHAEGLIRALSAGQVQVARALFLRLVTVEGTRRIHPRSQLLEGLGEGASDVLDNLVRGRVIVARKSWSSGGEEAALELVHESLIRSWARLAHWIEESREEIAFLAQLEQAAALWEKRGSRADEVWRGEALAEARTQADGLSTELPRRVVRFITAGVQREGAERRRKWIRLAAVAATVLAVGATTALAVHWSADDPCPSPERRLEGIWDGEVRSVARSSFNQVDRPYAADTYDRVERILDQYADDWLGMHTEACEATNVRGEQSEPMLDLRMACLDRRLAEMQALVGVFAGGLDGDQLDRAVQASLALGPLAACADAEALAAVVPPPGDRATREQVDELRDGLARAAALEGTGRYEDALALAEAVWEDAAAVEYAPLRAEAALQLGTAQRLTGDAATAEDTLYEATRWAGEARDDELTTAIWFELVHAVGVDQARFDEGAAFLRSAEVSAARAGEESGLRARLLSVSGTVAAGRGAYPVSQELHQRALDARLQTLGPDHPDVADSLNNLGTALWFQGNYEEAFEHYQRSLGIRERSLGPDHPRVADSLGNMGMVLSDQGKHSEAQQTLERALAIEEAALGEDHPRVANSLNGCGVAYHKAGKLEEARRYYERSLAIKEAELGTDHPKLADSLFNLGLLLDAQGEPAGALQYYARSLDIWETSLGEEHPDVAYPLSAIGACFLGLSRPAEAVAPLERARRIREATGTDPNLLAETQFALARALWSSRGDRARALELASASRETWGETRGRFTEELAAVEDWLASRGR